MMLATLAHQHNYHPCAMHQQCIITLNCTFLQLHWTGSCSVPSPYPTITPHLLKLYWPGCRLSPPSSLMIFSIAFVSFPRTNRTKATVWNFHLAWSTSDTQWFANNKIFSVLGPQGQRSTPGPPWSHFNARTTGNRQSTLPTREAIWGDWALAREAIHWVHWDSMESWRPQTLPEYLMIHGFVLICQPVMYYNSPHSSTLVM